MNPALLGERKAPDSSDTANYPHRAILALVNWPLGVTEVNPAHVLGRTSVDRLHGWYVFRTGWQGTDDVVVSLWLGSGPKGNISAGGPDLRVWGMGERVRLASLPPCQTSYYKAEKEGSGVVSGGGYSVAVDLSGRSGAPVLVAVARERDLGKFAERTGSGVAKVSEIKAGKTPFRVLTMGHGAAPEVKVDGDRARIGGRMLSFDGQKVESNDGPCATKRRSHHHGCDRQAAIAANTFRKSHVHPPVAAFLESDRQCGPG